jgi:hypothetical protein
VRWTATDPAGGLFDEGDLPAITGPGAFRITVHQIHAVGRP